MDLLSIALIALLTVSICFLVASDKGRRGLELALRSLWLHKLRSFLSMLGIIIGTSAVIILMSFGEGSEKDVLDDIKRLGTTNIIARSVKPPHTVSPMTMLKCSARFRPSRAWSPCVFFLRKHAGVPSPITAG